MTAAVWIARVLCPAVALASLILAIVAAADGRTAAVALNAFCFGVNVILTWVEWRIVKTPKEMRRCRS